PLLAEERARKREELLCATEHELEKIRVATARKRAPLRGADAIGVRVGKVIGQHKMAKHFALEITDDGFRWRRKPEQIDEEASRDGLYVIRTNVPQEALSGAHAIAAYKGL